MQLLLKERPNKFYELRFVHLIRYKILSSISRFVHKIVCVDLTKDRPKHKIL